MHENILQCFIGHEQEIDKGTGFRGQDVRETIVGADVPVRPRNIAAREHEDVFPYDMELPNKKTPSTKFAEGLSSALGPNVLIQRHDTESP